MGHHEKFLFETSFEPEKVREARERAAKEATPPPEPPAPTFSEEELEAVRQGAFAEGRAAGLAEAEAAHGKRLADAVASLPEQFATLAQTLEAQEAERSRAALESAITVVRKLFPQLARDGGMEEIRAVVESCMERLRNEPRLMIRTADADLDALRESIEGSAARSGFEGKLVFLTDERIASGDLRIEWADGGAERDQAALWAEIDGVIARALRPAKNAPAPAGLPKKTPPKQAPATTGESSAGQKPVPNSTEPHSQPRKSAEIEPLRRAQTA